MLVAIISFASFSISTSAFGQDKYSVSGEIIFYEERGEFQVQLKTEYELENAVTTIPTSRNLLIKPNANQLKTKKFAFKFVDVPAGTYSIYCLHDLNNNGKMDRAPKTGIPTEPYGYSGELFFGRIIWQNVSFKVDKNIRGIEIKLLVP